MKEYEFLIDRLREVAKGMDHPQRRTLIQAADALENQRSQIDSLQEICEKQAGLNQRVLDLAMELDRTKSLLDMAREERDAVTKRMIELEQEAFARNSHEVASNEQVTDSLCHNGSGGSETSSASDKQVNVATDPAWKRRFLGTFLKGSNE